MRKIKTQIFLILCKSNISNAINTIFRKYILQSMCFYTFKKLFMTVSIRFCELQQIKFEKFKLQDPESGRFDVIFELEGKKLYAHKPMLNLVSDTFDAMLSDRWTSADGLIKLEDYTFDDFFEFITFLYSAQCNLTDENITSMIDIAEYYNVAAFKNYCDEYLADMKFTSENIVQFLDLADKYSLGKVKTAMHDYIANNLTTFGNSDAFLTLQKSILGQIVIAIMDKVKPEELFKAVYKWTETQVGSNQESDPLLNKNDAIKFEILDFLPYIKFNKMKIDFLDKFVVPRGFIFSSYDELSKILCDARLNVYAKFTVTNIHGQKLIGHIIPDETIIETIKALKLSDNSDSSNTCSWKGKCEILYTNAWFLKYKKTDTPYVKLRNIGNQFSGEYLYAEMKTEEGKDFCVTNACKIEIEY